ARGAGLFRDAEGVGLTAEYGDLEDGAIYHWFAGRGGRADVGGFGATGGAAAGLGQAGAGNSLEATRMMEALHSMQALPGPGEVLQLGAFFLFHPDYSSLFVRECYPRLFDALTRHPKPKRFIVTGTPGIGKSWFFYYLLARLLKSTTPPSFIVWEHNTKPGKAWCYTHKTREVVVGERTSFDHVLLDPAAWYIADGVPPQLNCLARIVLLTSPKHETYKEVRKASGKMLYMPLWELDELLECRRLLYDTVSEGLAKDLYQYYGGAARFVLESPNENPELLLDDLLDELREAVGGCSTAQPEQPVPFIVLMQTDAKLNWLNRHGAGGHPQAAAHRGRRSLLFASQWVAEEFAKKAMKDELQGLGSLLGTTSGALQGMLYEATMHTVLPKGGRFTVTPVNHTLRRGAAEELDLRKAASVHVYYRPSSATLPTVDAFERGKDTYDFFQMTVGSSKEVDFVKLNSVLSQVQLPEGVTPRLHFVVPEDRYESFKLTAGDNWPPTSRQAASRMKLYIMKGVYSQLQVVADINYPDQYVLAVMEKTGGMPLYIEKGDRGPGGEFSANVSKLIRNLNFQQ
ncbi:hypothetical protein TSOC_000560, partial [Tetrabaena socialis]